MTVPFAHLHSNTRDLGWLESLLTAYSSWLKVNV